MPHIARHPLVPGVLFPACHWLPTIWLASIRGTLSDTTRAYAVGMNEKPFAHISLPLALGIALAAGLSVYGLTLAFGGPVSGRDAGSAARALIVVFGLWATGSAGTYVGLVERESPIRMYLQSCLFIAAMITWISLKPENIYFSMGAAIVGTVAYVSLIRIEQNLLRRRSSVAQ